MKLKTEHSIKRFMSYKYEVRTVNTIQKIVRPHLIDTQVYGQHISYVEDGIRIWRFQDKEGYLKFCENYTAYINNP